MTEPLTRGVHHVGLVVPDLDAAEGFFVDALGWRITGSVPSYDDTLPSRIDHAAHISTPQYASLRDEWVTSIGLRREDYGIHALRRWMAESEGTKTL